MLLFASSRDEVDGVIDESLLKGDDDVELDAEKVQKERRLSMVCFRSI